MPWSKLSDDFHEHPKIVAMSDKAFRLYVCSITYSSRHHLNGVISPSHAKVLFRLTSAREKHVDELLKLFAWEKSPEGYVIHGFQEYNPDQSELSRKRSEAGKQGGTNTQLRQRRLKEAREKGTHTEQEWVTLVSCFDGNCACCGNGPVVKDHIIPIYQGGSDSIHNIQPLCAACNSRKGPDTTDYRVWSSKFQAIASDLLKQKASKGIPDPDPIPMPIDIHHSPTSSDVSDLPMAKSPCAHRRPAFHKPSLEECREYFADSQYPQEADAFFDYYEANGWRVGKNPMRDVRAAVRNWLRRRADGPSGNGVYGGGGRPDKRQQQLDDIYYGGKK